MLPIQCEFLQIFENEALQNSTQLNVHYFFCSLQIIVGCIKWLREINVWDCYVVIVSPNIELETYVVPTSETQVMVYVLMIFPKALVEAKNTKHLKKLFGFNKLLKFVELKTFHLLSYL